MIFEIGQQVNTPNGKGHVVEVYDGRDDPPQFFLSHFPGLRVKLHCLCCIKWFMLEAVRSISPLEQLAEAAE